MFLDLCLCSCCFCSCCSWIWIWTCFFKKKKKNWACDFLFLIFFIQLKLIIFFFNLDADVAFFNAKKHFLLLIQAMWTLIQYYLFLPFATSTFSVSDVTAGTKMGSFFRIGTKHSKNKMQGLKWELPENVRTKRCFLPNFSLHFDF